MDYKRIIKSKRVRLKILELLRFIPDKTMVSWQYRIKTGRKLNLTNPKRFTEKIQWYKLYYRDPKMIKCVDKYDVREYVISKGYQQILVPCYGVFNTGEEIEWQRLPSRFVLKDTLGSGGTSVIMVEDKDRINISQTLATLREWTNSDSHIKTGGREWPYYSGKEHRIIVEQMLEQKGEKSILDYKFFCFNGKVEFVYLSGNRTFGESVSISILNREFEKLPVIRVGDSEYNSIVKPQNYEKMLEIAENLSSDFPHVRVDLYNIDGNVYFGELTFYNASGYMLYDPDSFDLLIGEKWNYPDN